MHTKHSVTVYTRCFPCGESEVSISGSVTLVMPPQLCFNAVVLNCWWTFISGCIHPWPESSLTKEWTVSRLPKSISIQLCPHWEILVTDSSPLLPLLQVQYGLCNIVSMFVGFTVLTQHFSQTPINETGRLQFYILSQSIYESQGVLGSILKSFCNVLEKILILYLFIPVYGNNDDGNQTEK